MHVIEEQTGRDAMLTVVDAILREGKPVAPRGIKTLELSPCTVVIHNPRDVMPTGINRQGLHPAIGVAEGLQAIAGISLPTLMGRISPAFNRFTNVDGQFDGAYGPRLQHGLSHVAARLEKDPDSRQAIATIWWPHDSRRDTSRDYPCTLSLHFLVRESKLNLHVLMRSNDVWLGFPYDIFQFAQLQLSMANCLALEPGTYTHTANSLHLYETNIEAAEDLYPSASTSGAVLTNGVGSLCDHWYEIEWRAEQLLLGLPLHNMTESEHVYDQLLDPFTGAGNVRDKVYTNVYGVAA